MNILIVSQYYAPEPLPKVTELAVGLRRRGHSVTVITGFPNYPYGKIYDGYKLRWWQIEELDGVRVIRVPLYPDHSRSKIKRFLNYVSFGVFATVAGLILKSRDAMVVFHPPMTMGIPARVIAAVKKSKFIYCISDLWPDLMIASGVVKGNFLIRSLYVLEKFVYAHADVLAPVSQSMLERLEEKGVPSEKLVVLPDWADETLFRPVSPDLDFISQYDLEGKFTIVFAGQLGIAQDLDTFIDSLKLLEGQIAVSAVIVGDGIEKERLMTKVDELSLKNVHFAGRLPQDRMSSIYAIADVLLVQLNASAQFSMSVPAKVYGYMATGQAVLGAVSGETANLIEEAKCGLVCPPGDPVGLANRIIDFVGMPEIDRAEMGERGRRFFLEKYSFSNTLSKYERLLEDLCH